MYASASLESVVEQFTALVLSRTSYEYVVKSDTGAIAELNREWMIRITSTEGIIVGMCVHRIHLAGSIRFDKKFQLVFFLSIGSMRVEIRWLISLINFN